MSSFLLGRKIQSVKRFGNYEIIDLDIAGVHENDIIFNSLFEPDIFFYCNKSNKQRYEISTEYLFSPLFIDEKYRKK